MFKKLIISSISIFALSSCIVFNDTANLQNASRTIFLRVQDNKKNLLKNAVCNVTTPRNKTITVHKTPDILDIYTVNGILDIKCTLEGYRQSKIIRVKPDNLPWLYDVFMTPIDEKK